MGQTHLDKDVPVSVLVEKLSVHELKLGDISASILIFLSQLGIRVFALRVFVEEFHVRVSWGRVEVVVNFLDVLSVVTCRSAAVQMIIIMCNTP